MHPRLSYSRSDLSNDQIILGVHGNGLTHQLLMPPSLRSTTIEMVVPKGEKFANLEIPFLRLTLRVGYVYDYWMLAANVGHKHYMVANDTVVTYPRGMHHEVSLQLSLAEGRLTRLAVGRV